MDPIQLLQQLVQEVASLKKEIIQLKAEVQKLEAEMQIAKEEKLSSKEELPEKTETPSPSTFRRLTYHIQNLNVKTLSGTLNIGLVAGTSEGDVLEQLSGFGVHAEEEGPKNDPEQEACSSPAQSEPGKCEAKHSPEHPSSTHANPKLYFSPESN